MPVQHQQHPPAIRDPQPPRVERAEPGNGITGASEQDRPVTRSAPVRERTTRLDGGTPAPAHRSDASAIITTDDAASWPEVLTHDADLLADVSQLRIDELTLDLSGQVGIDHLKIEARGVDAGLFLKADLDNVVALTGKAPRRRAIDVPAAFHAARRTVPSTDGAGAEQAGDDTGGGGHSRTKRVLAEGGAVTVAAALGAAGAAALEGRRPKVAGIRLPRGHHGGAKRAVESIALPLLRHGGKRAIAGIPVPLPRHSGAKRAVDRARDLVPGL